MMDDGAIFQDNDGNFVAKMPDGSVKGYKPDEGQ
jgi:hypothetical protein